MGNIFKKGKGSIKGFFDQGKKLVEPPKELPDIIKEVPPPASPVAHAPPVPTIPNIHGKEQQIVGQREQQPEHKEPVVQQQERKDFSLPKIQPPIRQGISQAPPPRDEGFHEDDMKEFEEAINNINIDIIHSEAPETIEAAQSRKESSESRDYYKPAELGEGYFSEVEHYIKNKDVHEIIDDIMKKDFLTSMKDYHDNKAEGKPFYLHEHDLEQKLKKKMNQLRKLEEEWHGLITEIKEKEKKQKEIEAEIERESQELKELFRQIKINQVLEKEAPKEYYFHLVTGAKIKNLNELRKALSYMTEEEFKHHVTQERNDFATWIRDVMQNQELYEKIKGIKSKEGIQDILKNPL